MGAHAWRRKLLLSEDRDRHQRGDEGEGKTHRSGCVSAGSLAHVGRPAPGRIDLVPGTEAGEVLAELVHDEQVGHRLRQPV